MTNLWVVRKSLDKDDLFVCEAKGFGRVARVWNGRTDRDHNAFLLAAAPFMRETLEAVNAHFIPCSEADDRHLRLVRAAIATSYMPQGGIR